MSQGTALTDNDRWDWLIALREAVVARLSPSKTLATKRHDGVVITYSTLKRKYRDVIRIATYNDHDVMVHFIYLRADADVLLARVTDRKDHCMKSAMVRSQIEALEEPDATEQGRRSPRNRAILAQTRDPHLRTHYHKELTCPQARHHRPSDSQSAFATALDRLGRVDMVISNVGDSGHNWKLISSARSILQGRLGRP